MGNRKENLKNSLGITEYPWSSDDESNPSVNTVLRNPTTENRGQNMPGPSGQQTPLSPSRSRAAPSRLESDIFWTLLNINTGTTPEPISYRAGTSRRHADETRERIDLESPVANIQRLFAINRLPKNNNASRTNRRRALSPLMADLSATVKLGRIKRRPPCRPGMVPCGRNSTARRQDLQDEHTKHLPYSVIDRISFADAQRTSVLSFPSLSSSLQIIPAVMDSITAPEAQASSSRGGVSRHNVHISLSVNEHSPIQPVSPRSNNNNNEEGMQVSPLNNSLPEGALEIDAAVEGSRPGQTITNPQAARVHNETVGASGTSTSSAPAQTFRWRTESRDDEPVSLHDFNQGLLRLLECPVCMEWMEPPLAQCRRGHLVCARCRKRLGACPVCRTAFSSVRNRAMESVTEMLRYPCRHGCGRDTRLRSRAAHEASCDARLYRCPAPSCIARAPLPLAELHHHCQADHPSMVRVGRRHRFSIRTSHESHSSWLLATAGALFQVRVDTDVRAWGVYVYVVYFGPQCNAPNYTYEVTVVGHHNNRRLVYARATHSDLECNSLNVRRQDCFHLTAEQTPNFVGVKTRHNKPEQYLDFIVDVSGRAPTTASVVFAMPASSATPATPPTPTSPATPPTPSTPTTPTTPRAAGSATAPPTASHLLDS